MNRVIRFFLNYDPAAGELRLRVPKNTVSQREYHQLRAEMRRAFDRLVRQHGRALVLQTPLQCVPPKTRFRIYVRPGNHPRYPLVALESEGATTAESERTPPWQDGFQQEMEELISWSCLHDESSDADSLRPAVQELRRMGEQSSTGLFAVLVTSYLMLARTLCEANDSGRRDRYRRAIRSVSHFFGKLVLPEPTQDGSGNPNLPHNDGSVTSWLREFLDIDGPAGYAVPQTKEKTPPIQFGFSDSLFFVSPFVDNMEQQTNHGC